VDRIPLEVFGLGVVLSYSSSSVVLAQHPGNLLIAICVNVIGCSVLVTTAIITPRLKETTLLAAASSRIKKLYVGDGHSVWRVSSDQTRWDIPAGGPRPPQGMCRT
jgi:hypothetical protein